MASIIKDPNGRKRIQFEAGDGKRKAIRLGKVSMKQAEAFKAKLEAIVGQSITGVADDEVSRWMANLDPKTYNRLAAVGLVERRNEQGKTIGKLTEEYIVGRSDAKPRTIINLRQAQKRLLEFLGNDKPLKEITEADAEEFWRYLLAAGLAHNTARRTCGRAKQFLRYAVRKRLIVSNPFAELKSTVGSNSARQFFVTPEVAQKVLDACPDAEWRLIFALSRYAGLRCPSEVLALRWQDVDWEKNRFTVRSPKTEHHEGKESRVVPIFSELYPHLRDAFELATPGAAYAIMRYRDAGVNLRTQLERIIRRAGVAPWEKPFHNMRATRETELAERYPIHVVCSWIGNSATVAQKHYLQVTEDHFADAAAPNEKAAQNPAQSAAKQGCRGWTEVTADVKKRSVFQGLTEVDNCRQVNKLPLIGLEPITR